MGKYDDIMNLPHHTSKNHPQMSLNNRAAQFAPFAALVGYDESINEAGRLVDQKITLGIDKIEEISRVLTLLNESIDEQPKVNITFFKKDVKKSGGKYVNSTFNLIKVDTASKKLILDNKITINFDDIIDISIAS